MSFSLHAHERPADGLLRILVTQLAAARECVANDGRLTDKEIHNARKSIKRARATLRLLRPALDCSVFKEANRALRDISRPLTHVRDAKVLLDSLDALRNHFGDAARCLSTDMLEHALQVQRARARREISATADTVEQLRSALRKIETDVKQWHIKSDKWDLLGTALERIYRDARRAYAKVSEARSDERLHEWRKQVKHYWYALQILTPLRPGQVGESADRAHKLTDYLGDDHDLANLRRYIGAIDEDEDMIETLEALIDRRRNDLQDRAFAVGERLLNRKPKRVVRSLKSHWRSWRKSRALPSLPEPSPRARPRSNGNALHLH